MQVYGNSLNCKSLFKKKRVNINRKNLLISFNINYFFVFKKKTYVACMDEWVDLDVAQVVQYIPFPVLCIVCFTRQFSTSHLFNN